MMRVIKVLWILTYILTELYYSFFIFYIIIFVQYNLSSRGFIFIDTKLIEDVFYLFHCSQIISSPVKYLLQYRGFIEVTILFSLNHDVT